MESSYLLTYLHFVLKIDMNNPTLIIITTVLHIESFSDLDTST